MAPEKKAEGRFTTRQKVTAVAFVLILIVIVWQIMGLFGGGSSAPVPTIKPNRPAANQMTATAPGTTGAPAARNPNVAPPVAGGAQPPVVTPQQLEEQAMRETPVNMDARLVELQKNTEQKYIEQINQLQTLKLQREIEETNQAIAAAKLATVTAEKNVRDVLTRPLTQSPQTVVPNAAYASSLVNPVTSGTTVTSVTETITVQPIIPYTVISVSMELGKWKAVIGHEGKLYNVTIGDVLPPDSSIVSSINKNGVVLTKDGKTRMIRMVSTI